MNAFVIVGIICLVCFAIELIVLLTSVKNPLHLHGNSKVLLAMFINKDKYNAFKDAALARGYNKIEPYIESLIEKDIDEMNK
jgi:hypothetical protein